MKAYALDSNIISAMLKNNENIIDRYEQELIQGKRFIIPPIVFYEIQRGLLSKNMLKRLKIFEEFCKDVEVGEFNIHVWMKAAQIYAMLSKQGNPVGTAFDGDVFIAAYCIINDCILVTNNKEHFKRIDDLQLESWIDQL